MILRALFGVEIAKIIQERLWIYKTGIMRIVRFI